MVDGVPAIFRRLCRAQCGEACLTGQALPKEIEAAPPICAPAPFEFTQVDDQLYAYCSAG
jgi:hypothetical protein